MLIINPIRNVQNTINKNNISFKSGVRTNYGADSINVTGNKERNGFLAEFLGTVKQSPLFYETFFERQATIEKGLGAETNNFNAIA